MSSIGKIFFYERQKRKLTLEELEKDLKIRKKYLVKIERDEWDFTSRIYLEGIIKNYAQYLNLDQKKILAIFRREYDKKEEINFKEKLDEDLVIADKNRWFKIGLFLLGIFFISYFAYQLLNYFLPPKIKIISPKTKNFIGTDKVKIIGQTKPESQIFILGNEVYPDKNGFFSYELPLIKGDNKLIIEVIGPNGKKATYEQIYHRQ